MNKVKRFISPFFDTPFLYVRAMLVYAIWGLNGVVHVLFLERLTYFLEHSDRISFNSYLIYYLIFIVIYEIVYFGTRKYAWTEDYNQTVINVQNRYLKDFFLLDNNKIEEIGTGKMVAIIKGGIDTWGRLAVLIIGGVPRLLISIIFTFFMLFQAGPIYAFLFLVFYFLFHLISYFFNKQVLDIRKERTDFRNAHTKHFVKVLMSKFEILQSHKYAREIDILDNYKRGETEKNKAMAFPVLALFRAPEFGVDMILLFVFYYFGFQVFSGALELSTFVGISGMLILMKKAISRSIEIYKNFTKEFVDIEKLWELYDMTPKITGYDTGKDFSYKTGNIELKNIDFSYNDAKAKIFDNFSLVIEGGKIIAFVGDSGAGKSTLVKLIAGYIKPCGGEIIIDKQSLSSVSLNSYYKNIGFLTQEPSVFDGTILENLTYAVEGEVTKEEIEKIIKLAKCEFIYDFKNGLATTIGERGIKLSGGQKQRLAIAKIFLKNPHIIILDEPTSALDSFSEEKITEALYNLFRGRTVIVIAHRLQTVRHADMIYVLGNGEVVESGNHKELLKKKGIYKRMLDLQSGF